MTNTRASLRSDNCPTSIGMSVRFELEQVSDFVGMRSHEQIHSLGDQYRSKRGSILGWFSGTRVHSTRR